MLLLLVLPSLLVRSVLQYVAVCCSALQCAVVCCSALQCVAVHCNMSQFVSVCCSVHPKLPHFVIPLFLFSFISFFSFFFSDAEKVRLCLLTCCFTVFCGTAVGFFLGLVAWVCVCVRVCVCVCVLCVCVCVCVAECVSVFCGTAVGFFLGLFAWACTCVSVTKFMYVYVWLCMCVCGYVCVCVAMYVCVWHSVSQSSAAQLLVSSSAM